LFFATRRLIIILLVQGADVINLACVIQVVLHHNHDDPARYSGLANSI
jgi:hypothetical protein